MLKIRTILPLLLLFVLSACAKSVWAPDDAVAKARYVSNEPTSITLITVINNNTGEGGHTAILINGSERVIFDPAGNWKNPNAPERNDFVYGMTPAVYQTYLNFHARTAWHVVMQKIEVAPEVAEMAIKLTKENGAVAGGFCASATTKLLTQLPGFESLPRTFFPKKLMKEFAQLPGVEEDKFFQYD